MTIKSVAHNNLTTDFKKYFKIHYITLYLYSLFIRCSYKKMVFVILFHYHQQSIEESGDYFAALSQSHVFSCCPWQLQMVWRYLQTAVTSSEWSCISWWLQILQIETAADAADGDDKHLSPDMIECGPSTWPSLAWPLITAFVCQLFSSPVSELARTAQMNRDEAGIEARSRVLLWFILALHIEHHHHTRGVKIII